VCSGCIVLYIICVYRYIHHIFRLGLAVYCRIVFIHHYTIIFICNRSRVRRRYIIVFLHLPRFTYFFFYFFFITYQHERTNTWPPRSDFWYVGYSILNNNYENKTYIKSHLYIIILLIYVYSTPEIMIVRLRVELQDISNTIIVNICSIWE